MGRLNESSDGRARARCQWACARDRPASPDPVLAVASHGEVYTIIKRRRQDPRRRQSRFTQSRTEESTVRCLLVALSFAVVGCRATPAPRPESPMSSPGPAAPWLTPVTLARDVSRWRVTIRGIRDSADRPFSEKTVAQSLISSESPAVLIVSRWPPPTTSNDSLVIAPDGLRPIREALAFNGFTRHYQYAGSHVWGTVQHGDSAARAVDRMFPEPVLAFSEVDLLIRSVPFRRGWSVVVPLFSEADEDVEHDTITVVEPTVTRRNGHDESAWLVRFADPAIVSSYVVLVDSRDIVAIDTEQRRSRAVIRYRGIA